MSKNAKLILAASGGFVSGFIIGNLAGFAKLVSLGKSPWMGHVRVLFLPVMRIEITTRGFTARTEYGVLVLGIIFSLVAVSYVLVTNWGNYNNHDKE